MSEFFMIIGFALAAYAIVANDSIQTLGSFLASNQHRKWWVLWIFISGIMVAGVAHGWWVNGGDPAFGRLASEGRVIPVAEVTTWVFVIPPLALVLLTRAGIPVSTSLLILTAYKGLYAAQQGDGVKDAVGLFGDMMEKSLVGYAIAFVLGLTIFWAVLGVFEKKVKAELDGGKDPNDNHKGWVVFQWFSTALLWYMWLVQDLANIFCYLPRKLTAPYFFLALATMAGIQGYIFYCRGGKIQGVVNSKVNTMDVRSASFIDFFYGIVLTLFKFDVCNIWPENLPMSTTWIFLGLLAGRELGIMLKIQHRSKTRVSRIIFGDAGKAFMGSVVAVVLAIVLPLFVVPLAEGEEEKATPQEEVEPGE
jgi:hypothetical protein